ncbi:MAG TPA: hypothetical protein VFV97_04725 [Rhodanobacteraceae bacterium]|nr:hypothetical protein [Rhodanobacteraceae bacterium]
MKTFTQICFVGAAMLVAGSAHALRVNSGGEGQVLLYPYYTVNANQDTYVTIANTEFVPVIAHVRFLEGQRGRPVLDLNVVLRPHATWAAAVTLSASGGAKLVMPDPSCTSPTIPATGLDFTASGYDGSGSIPQDDGPQGIDRTKEGFIEVIGGASFGNGDPVFGVDPNHPEVIDCSTVFDQLAAGSFPFGAPTNIAGSGAVIDVGSGTYYAFAPTAISEFSDVSLYNSNWGPLHPSLADAHDFNDPDGHSIARFHATGASVATPDELIAVFPDGVDAVTAVLMADSVQNDVVLDPGLGAETDWVLTMPTRRFYSDAIYPEYNTAGAAVTTTFSYGFNLYDRSGAAHPFTLGTTIPRDVEVFGFAPVAGPASPVFGSTLQIPVTTDLTNGSARIDLGGPPRVYASGNGYPRFAGLYGNPMIGFMAYKIVNANAQPGLLANYGAAFEMRRTACFEDIGLDPFICRH